MNAVYVWKENVKPFCRVLMDIASSASINGKCCYELYSAYHLLIVILL